MNSDEQPERKPLAPGRGQLLHKIRLYQIKSAQAGEGKTGVGYPKRRKPSMPQMPWDKKDSE